MPTGGTEPQPPRPQQTGLEPVGDGLLVIDKPAGWTSHDVVGRCRRLCATRRVGHAGTLDPMATGVLVLGVNRATKLLTFLVGADKAYSATIRLGVSTVTDDAEGEVTDTRDVSTLTREQIAEAVSGLTGVIQQVPSAVSAIKVGGKRSYARVRAGEDVELAARPVTVRRFDVLEARWSAGGDAATGGSGPAGGNGVLPHVDLDVVVEVSSGTYVRALARDLGAELGVGGHLTALRRTRVGDVDLASATTLEQLEADGAAAHLVPLAEAAAATFPVRHLSAQEATDLGHGKRLPAAVSGRPDPVAAIGPDGRLVAMLDETGEVARSHVVFPAP
ncbi:tRNA pseudouridine(55) synthase TruB [Ornithinimicrobium sp. F0845]|uniref:tRNA pseudouridine(55) synthase TruB n=1 Tax=Ornithinimicrobium sp. F0845 TaxID=2926412 RepID=UPI001FF24C23|nr:tRNA pseudouridine(55) synthase TruB [Ornithinimicrobium sp. F0845]MCK0111239.1 tRNA pseudouridine(55) synthase TruB [Ornithinimicrobium sp. F0845]